MLAWGIIALIVGALCFYVPASPWAREKYEAKFGDEVEEKQAEYVRMFRYIGIAWIVIGLLQFIMM